MITPAGPGPFAVLLQQYRAAAGRTQEELAEEAGLSRRGISDLERGLRRLPHPATVRRLAAALNLDGEQRVALLVSAQAAAAVAGAGPLNRPPTPLPLTSFIGRENERAEIQRLLFTTRLLTLVGTGGVGKTRLALEVARPRMPASAAFVDFAPIAEGHLVPAAVAAALGIRERHDMPLLEVMSAALAQRSVLLVLDNCEHLVQECAEFADDLLGVCPRLSILATSRQPLRVAGEQCWPVPPLRLPELTDFDSAAASEAVQLFVERARLVQPTFSLDERNASVVAEVCRRLDGIPLAIELAAARVVVLTPGQLAARLDDRFRLLTHGTRTAPLRQRTLRAVVDWSYELLTDPERRLFNRLSIFSGGWTLEMAEQICAGDGLEAPEVFDLLARLVEKSVVLVSQEDGQSRYSFLETLRQYAAEHLEKSVEESFVRVRHLDWCVALAERADADKDGPRRAAWLSHLEREHGNFRAALDWSMADSRALESTLRLVGALAWFWWFKGHAREGSRRMSAALERPLADDETNPAASPVFRARAWALAEAGRLYLRQRDLASAQRLLEEALNLAQQVRAQEAEACALLYLGELDLEQDNSTAARAHLLAGFELTRAQPWTGPSANRYLHWLGHAAEADAQPAEAVSLYARARQLASANHDEFFEAVAVRGLASAAMESGDLVAARAFLAETVDLFLRVENSTLDQSILLAYFARLAAAEAQAERALRLAGAAAALCEEAGTQLFRFDGQLLERGLESARRRLGESVAAAADAEGRAMGREAAFAYAVASLEVGPATPRPHRRGQR